MKCPACDGSGRVPAVATTKDYGSFECSICGGAKAVCDHCGDPMVGPSMVRDGDLCMPCWVDMSHDDFTDSQVDAGKERTP